MRQGQGAVWWAGTQRKGWEDREEIWRSWNAKKKIFGLFFFPFGYLEAMKEYLMRKVK